jgi:hypothetical protein
VAVNDTDKNKLENRATDLLVKRDAAADAALSGVSRQWREVKGGWGFFFVLKGQEDSAQGFNPGKHPNKMFRPERARDHVALRMLRKGIGEKDVQ